MGNLFRYADETGDGTGNDNANVDGSVTPVDFKMQVTADNPNIDVYRMIVFIKDSGSFDSGSYGNGVVMTNGITITIHEADGTFKKDLLSGKTVKINPDWTRICYDATVSVYGAGSETLAGRWTFSASGSPISLETGEYIRVRINDDLTGLEEHTFMFQGVLK